MEDLELLKQIRENINNNSIIKQKQIKGQHNLKKNSKKKLIDLIEKHGLSHLKNNILSLAEEAIIIKKTEKEDYKKVGNSRLCGYPDLPKEIEWPKILGSGYGYHKNDIGLLKPFSFSNKLRGIT